MYVEYSTVPRRAPFPPPPPRPLFLSGKGMYDVQVSNSAIAGIVAAGVAEGEEQRGGDDKKERNHIYIQYFARRLCGCTVLFIYSTVMYIYIICDGRLDYIKSSMCRYSIYVCPLFGLKKRKKEKKKKKKRKKKKEKSYVYV